MTICTQNRECLFGDIQHNEMVLNHAGKMVSKTWNDLSIKCPGIAIDEFIVMPNHVHGIMLIVGAPLVGALSSKSRTGGIPNDRAGTRPAPTTTTLGNVVGIFKSISTHQYAINVNANKWRPFPGKLWQRNYYERIIRNEIEMNLFRQYIINNPSEWNNDKNNPGKII